MGEGIDAGYYWNPVKITFGAGSIAKLPQLLETLSGRRVTLITDANILDAIGLGDRLPALFKGYKVSVFPEVEPNPPVDNCQDAIRFALEHEAEIVVGIGGGSAQDTAKIVAAVTQNGGDVQAVLRGERKISGGSLPTVLVPTTAGTGSEVTRWGTLWDKVQKLKFSVESPSMYPTHALVDPELTLTLSPAWTAATGADALSHAMEAYWNKHHNPVSDVYALEAVRRIFEALPLAVTNPSNLAHRSKMLFASLLAGMAFSNTKTAAAHSLSYPMTLHYGVVHGQASSITLPALLRFNEQASRERMTDLARAVGGNSVDSGARRIQVLLQRIGLKTSLSELGIDSDGIEMCVREGYTPDRAGNNLRDLDAEGMREILTMIA